VDSIFNHLLVEFSVQISASDKDGNYPEKACEENVKGDQEQEKPPDRRHLASVLSSRHQVVRHDHRKLLAAIPSSDTRVLEMGEMGRYLPASQVRLMDWGVHLLRRRVAHVLRGWGPNIWWRETPGPGVHLAQILGHLGRVVIVVGIGMV
jgi:hypothetical protein